MTAPDLHIIAFDIPYPANYGGVIDVFYKLKALHAAGLRITFHAFRYGERQPQAELEKYAQRVIYYRRDTSWLRQISAQPYIVTSRKHPALLNNLQSDHAPVLAEGLHCSAFFAHPALQNRLKILRMHNAEADYYRNLAQIESNPLNKAFFWLESQRLQCYERKIISFADALLTISPADTAYFSAKHPQIEYIPPFHPHQSVDSEIGHTGDFALFHANLSVADNEESAIFLINEVFSRTTFPFIIAGRAPGQRLYLAAEKYPHISVKPDISQAEMENLQRTARVHIMWTMQNAGMKLKLLDALFVGRHCIANRLMTQKTGLEDLCVNVQNAEEAITALTRLRNTSFTETEKSKRTKVLQNHFSNARNADKIVSLLRRTPESDKFSP